MAIEKLITFGKALQSTYKELVKDIGPSDENETLMKVINFQDTTQKMKFSVKDFFSKRDQIRSFLRIWSHLLKKSLMENFVFCAMGGGLQRSSHEDSVLNSIEIFDTFSL